MAANLAGLVSAYALTPNDVAVHVLPLFHIAGITIGLLSTIFAGGSVVISPVFDPLSFPQLLREHQITWFTAVPTIFKSLIEHKGLFAMEVGNKHSLEQSISISSIVIMHNISLNPSTK